MKVMSELEYDSIFKSTLQNKQYEVEGRTVSSMKILTTDRQIDI